MDLFICSSLVCFSLLPWSWSLYLVTCFCSQVLHREHVLPTGQRLGRALLLTSPTFSLQRCHRMWQYDCVRAGSLRSPSSLWKPNKVSDSGENDKPRTHYSGVKVVTSFTKFQNFTRILGCFWSNWYGEEANNSHMIKKEKLVKDKLEPKNLANHWGCPSSHTQGTWCILVGSLHFRLGHDDIVYTMI